MNIAPDNYEEMLSEFLTALDEWGCDCNTQKAKMILDFQRSGYRLDEYVIEHGQVSAMELN